MSVSDWNKIEPLGMAVGGLIDGVGGVLTSSPGNNE